MPSSSARAASFCRACGADHSKRTVGEGPGASGRMHLALRTAWAPCAQPGWPLRHTIQCSPPIPAWMIGRRTLRAFFFSRFASCRSLLYFSLRTTLFLMNDVFWPAAAAAQEHAQSEQLLPWQPGAAPSSRAAPIDISCQHCQSCCAGIHAMPACPCSTHLWWHRGHWWMAPHRRHLVAACPWLRCLLPAAAAVACCLLLVGGGWVATKLVGAGVRRSSVESARQEHGLRWQHRSRGEQRDGGSGSGGGGGGLQRKVMHGPPGCCHEMHRPMRACCKGCNEAQPPAAHQCWRRARGGRSQSLQLQVWGRDYAPSSITGRILPFFGPACGRLAGSWCPRQGAQSKLVSTPRYSAS